MNKDTNWIMANLIASKNGIREINMIGDTVCRCSGCGELDTQYIIFNDGLITHLCDKHMDLYRAIRFRLDNKIDDIGGIEKPPE